MKTYIQIGASVGGDHFQSIIGGLTEPSRVFLIEPHAALSESLSRNYGTLNAKHEITILSCAISLHTGTEQFYEPPSSTEHASLLKRQWFPPNIVGKDVPTITFAELCSRYGITDIECLFIDTEGMDYEILNSIDLSAVRIQTIYFEKWAYDADDLNGKYRSGPKFFDEVIVPKFKDYTWETVMQEHMTNYKLTHSK